MIRGREGLGSYGIVAPTRVRVATKAQDGVQICPECGHPVGQSKGQQRIASPDLLDDDFLAQFGNGRELITHGWNCERHAYDVVMPTPVSGEDAVGMPAGWVGVRLQFADQLERWVPTPAQEVDR